MLVLLLFGRLPDTQKPVWRSMAWRRSGVQFPLAPRFIPGACPGCSASRDQVLGHQVLSEPVWSVERVQEVPRTGSVRYQVPSVDELHDQ